MKHDEEPSVARCCSRLRWRLRSRKTADDWYKEGETQYNLGNFDKAAEAFKQGFALETDESKKPAYLYNVAQAYRQGNKCKDAAFFYKRYLSLKDQDTVKPLKPEKRAEIEQRITELEECAKNQDAIAKKPPDNTLARRMVAPAPDDDRPARARRHRTGTKTGTGTVGDEVARATVKAKVRARVKARAMATAITKALRAIAPRSSRRASIGGGVEGQRRRLDVPIHRRRSR